MIAKLKQVFFALPPSARDAAASAYGWYLRSWRYGPDTEHQVEQALRRDSWSADEWSAYQHARLAPLLERAATRVPFYRQQWETRRSAGDMASWLDLDNWPVVSKEALRQNPRAFLADDVRPSRLFQSSTSGTSGSPITTWQSRSTARAWYALFEARNRRWYGVDRHMRWAILGGQVVIPAEQVKPPFWVWNAPLRQLYLSSLHLSSTNVDAYLDAMRRYRVKHMYGYASSMYWLARMASDRGLEAPQLIVVVSNAEPLQPHQRALIGKVFQCPVRDTYGMSEIVAAAGECEHGVMHMWPDAGVVEVFDDDDNAEVPVGSTGRLVCTGLLNDAMPLIRYEVGDRGGLHSAGAAPCECGRALPRFTSIEGRSSDNLITADGRRVFWLNPVFYELPVREAQIVQESLTRLRVNVVPDVGYDSSVGDVIQERLQQRMGNVPVEIQQVASIPRGANGKFRPVVNLIDAEPPSLAE